MIGPLQGSHEQLLPIWRMWSSARLGQSLVHEVASTVYGEGVGEVTHSLVRVVGVVLWEREMGRSADSIGG